MKNKTSQRSAEWSDATAKMEFPHQMTLINLNSISAFSKKIRQLQAMKSEWATKVWTLKGNFKDLIFTAVK